MLLDIADAQPQEVAKATSPTKLAHFVIKTNDVQASRDWWLTVLYGRVTFENDICCFITYDDEHHRVGIIKLPGLTPAVDTAVGVDHVAFTYDDLPALMAAYRRLKALSIAPFWSINHGPTISLYYRDPNYAKVELQYDVFRTDAEVEAFFASGAYDENCVGVLIDPDDMAGQIDAGTPVADLVVRPTLPAGVEPWSQVPDFG